MKVKVVSKKTIKPCTPTPQNLNKYKISFTDELMPPMNVGFILFYPSKPKRSSNLEESLAKILPHFYPLAGRYIRSHLFVDCSDQGAEFVVAEAADVTLNDFVAGKSATHDRLNDLLPTQFLKVDEAPDDPLLSIQVTEFKPGGGLAVGISISHRIFDASSVSTFVSAWSNIANNNPIAIAPSFDSPSLFPGENRIYFPHKTDEYPNNSSNTIVLKRFVFGKEAVMRLRSKLRRNSSRVRVVSALIAKALIRVDRAKHGKSRGCIIAQAVDMRPRTVPPLPKHLCRNLAIDSVTGCEENTDDDDDDVGIQELVDLITDAVDKTITDCAGLLSSTAEDARGTILDPASGLIERSKGGEVNVVLFSDCTKFGFYEADFGWGKPVWASIGSIPHENTTVFMTNKDGDAIEAWVHLNRSDMSVFERDQDIKFFTSVMLN